MDLSALPSVDQLLGRLALPPGRFPHSLMVQEIRRALDAARTTIRAGGEPPPLAEAVLAALEALEKTSDRKSVV